MNFYYQSFMVVSAATLEVIADMPSSYASMSPFEFFAELYALHYDLDDRLRPNVPAEVTEWLDQNIGAATSGRPAMPTPSAIHERSPEARRPAPTTPA